MTLTNINAAKKIMVVDDDAVLSEELAALLEDEGYRSVTFTSGFDAVEAARRAPPDLILLDLNLGLKDGFEVAMDLRKEPATANIPILAMTGFYQGEKYTIFMESIGFRGCLMKPLDLDLLLARIEEILRTDSE